MKELNVKGLYLENSIILKENETLDDLQTNGYKIIQSSEHFKFSIDAVLLSHYTTFKSTDIVLDMCSGTGIVALLVNAHNDVNRIDCIEIQEQLFDMCTRSVKYNNLTEKIYPFNMDLRNAVDNFGYEKYDAVLCNPPYLPLSAGYSSISEAKKIARFEVYGSLSDIINTSKKLLKNSGKLVMSYRSDRLADIIYLMRECNIQPKRCRFIHSKSNSKANLVLIEAVKNAKPSMIVEAPLIVYDENNNYMEDIYKIYKMDKNYE